MTFANWLYELGELKRMARSGWWSAKVRHPETVAEHTWRTAVIAYALALEEDRPASEANEAAVAALFHDAVEARTLDLHKVAKTYVKADNRRAEKDQSQNAPKKTRVALDALPANLHAIVKDADLLELAATAQEYRAAGYSEAKTWRDGVKSKLTTKTARKWHAEICRTKPGAWYEKLR